MTLFQNYAREINMKRIPYGPLSANSNAYAFNVARRVLKVTPKPVSKTPGAGYNL
jgi:hypothetical protein